MRTIFFVVLLFIGTSGVANAGRSPGDIVVSPEFHVAARELADCCPKPDWWDNVEAPVIRSSADFDEVWQSQTLSKSQKAKALFRAIVEFAGRNDEIAAMSINVYQYVDPGYPQLRDLLEFGVARYFDQDRLLAGYSGKKGDTAAGLVLKLSRLYLADGQPGEAAALVSRLVAERGHEINDHQLELASLRMADALISLGRQVDALDVVNHAIVAYDGSWEKRLDKKKSELRQDMGFAYYLHDRALIYKLSVVLVLLAGAAFVLFLRSSSRQRFS